MQCCKRGANQRGSVLLVTLFIAALFGIFLYSYLNIVQGQRAMVARSQAWNSAMAFAEAGVEEALAHLNPGAPRRMLSRSGNGWVLNGSGSYGPVTRSLSEGSYSVIFTDTRFPIIYSTGYVSVPSIPAQVKRVVEVWTTNSPLFTAAMAARYNIDFRGNGVTTDSFNSASSDFSLNGRYDPTRTLTNGDIASVGGVVNVRNADVNGSVLLGPNASAEPVSRNGIITGGIYNDFNVEFEDVVLPDENWPAAPILPATIETNSYDYAFNMVSGDYSIHNLRGALYIGPNTTVRLLLTGDATLRGLRIDGQGIAAGQLTIFMNGESFSISGGIQVDGGNAANLSYYGTPANTRITFSGNSSFTGTIYAPQADFRLGGGGENIYDFVGSCVVRSVVMNGHFNFHFDENLMRAGPMRPYVAKSWREI